MGAAYKRRVEARSPIHLSQKLVDGLPGVRVHGRLDSLSSDAVQLVDEDHTRGVRFGLA